MRCINCGNVFPEEFKKLYVFICDNCKTEYEYIEYGVKSENEEKYKSIKKYIGLFNKIKRRRNDI